jgi:DNA-binding transcriptional LysR family regulator
VGFFRRRPLQRQPQHFCKRRLNAQEISPMQKPHPKTKSAQGRPARKGLRPPRFLIYVDAVARHGSIRRAADALNMASSALNRHILDLELDLGTALFERLSRGVRATSAGELFLAFARQSISDLKTVESQIEQLRGLVRGQVNVAAAESVAGELLPAAISQFQAGHPNVRFHIRIGTPDELTAALIADRADLILTHEAPQRKDVAAVAVMRQALCVLVVTGHPLAARETVRLRDCLPYPLALADGTLAGRALIEQVLTTASYALEPRVVSNSVELMQAFAAMNLGVCFQFRKPGRSLMASGNMVALPLSDPPLMQAKLMLATRRDRVLPVAAAAFVEQLRQSFAAG